MAMSEYLLSEHLFSTYQLHCLPMKAEVFYDRFCLSNCIKNNLTSLVFLREWNLHNFL